MEDTFNFPANQIIKHGDYIIIQRQDYTKLHKFTTGDSTSMLGKDQIKLQNINGFPYFSSFKMIPKDKKKRIYTLEHCKNIHDLKEGFLDRKSGADNRNIRGLLLLHVNKISILKLFLYFTCFVLDDGQSQTLSTEDISRLKENDCSSTEIVSQLIENSKTFASKTEYSQEKYIKKKEKKYFEYLLIRKPTIRLITEIFYRQDPSKVLGLRNDSLAQLLCYANINSLGSFLLYESGTNGLLPAAIMSLIGENTTGALIHMHSGNLPQQQGILALNLSEEQRARCVSVNIYSVLRHYYQSYLPANLETVGKKKRKLSGDLLVESIEQTSTKKIKTGVENENISNGAEATLAEM